MKRALPGGVAVVLAFGSFVAPNHATSPTGFGDPRIREDFEREDAEAREAYRLLRLKGRPDGTFDPNDLIRAHNQKKAMRENPRLFGGPSGPGTRMDTSSWTEIGPGNIGGRIRSILIDKDTPQTMYVGAVAGGIWKTLNGGDSWTPLDDFLPSVAVTTLVRHPTNANILYAGTGEVTAMYPVVGAGVFKSVDGGAHWQQLADTTGEAYRRMTRLAIHPQDGMVLMAAAIRGLFRTSDGGTSWAQPGGLPLLEATDVAFHPTDGTRVVAAGVNLNAGASAAWFSSNGGATWTAASGFPANAGRVSLAWARQTPNRIIALNSWNVGELWVSINSGANWSRLGTATNLQKSQESYNQALWVDPTNSNNILVGGIDLRRSTDGGNTFNDRVPGMDNLHPDQHFIVEHPQFASNHTVFVANDGGIFKSEETITNPLRLNNQLRITQFYSATGNPTSGLIIGGTQDNGTSRYNGAVDGWLFFDGGDGGYTAVEPVLGPNGSTVFYSSSQYDRGPHRVTFDAAGNVIGFDHHTTFVPSPPDSFPFIAPTTLDPTGPGRLYRGGTQLWRVENPRTVVNGTYTSVKPVAELGGFISAIAVAPTNPDVIWVGHDFAGQVYKTENGTAPSPAWNRKGAYPVLPGNTVTSITIDPTDANRVYFTYGGFGPGNLRRTTDGGATFSDISVGLPELPVYAVEVFRHDPRKIYVGTEIGIYASEDGGRTWSTTNQGPSNAPVYDLFWMDNRLIAATFGRSMVSATIPIAPVVTITSPADGLRFQPGSDITITATATDPNGTVTKVQFYDGETLLGEDTTNPYAFTMTAVAEGSHVLTARGVDNQGNVGSSPAVTIRSALPAPWVNQDVGTTGAAGDTTFGSGTFTVSGAGTDIWGTADAFQFVNRPLVGNGEIVARVASLQNTDPFAKAGVMIRASLAPNAGNALMAMTAASGATFQRRTSNGGTTASTRTTGFAAPFWVRLVRSGNTFTGFRSPDGVTWTQQGTITFTMSSSAFVGLAVTSHKAGTLATATFTDVTVSGGGGDTSPPTVSVTAPASGAVVSGNTAVAATASDNVGVTGVQFKVDGVNVGAEDTTAPYGITWNTTASAIGVRALTAVARDGAGNSGTSPAVSVTVNNPPVCCNPVTPGNGQVTLGWTAVTGATSYRLKRSTSASGSFAVVATVPGTTHTDTGLSNGTTYFYVVSALNAGGFETTDSAPPVPATPQGGSAPPPPTGLTGTVGNLQAMLSWNAAAGATSYNVKRSLVSGGSYSTVGTATVTRFVDRNLTNGTPYHYVVTSVGPGGESQPSAQESVIPSASACATATGGASGPGSWVNRSFPSRNGQFSAEYDATPSALTLDGVIGLSQGARTAFTGFATLARFNPSSNIDARNGGTYAAAATIPYAAGGVYHFRLVINVPAHTYSIFVTPPGGTEQTVGSTFAFRTEQNAVTSLDSWGVIVNKAGTNLTNRACNFWVYP